MACNNRKDLGACVDRLRLRFFPDTLAPTCTSWEPDPGRRRRRSKSLFVYLWDSMEDLRTQAQQPEGTQACHVPQAWFWRSRLPRVLQWTHRWIDPVGDWFEISPEHLLWRMHVPPKVGELHFVVGMWTPGIVAHEVAHAIFHIMRMVGPTYSHVLENRQHPLYVHGCAEEDACYLHHELVDSVISWLVDVDSASRERIRCITAEFGHDS